MLTVKIDDYRVFFFSFFFFLFLSRRRITIHRIDEEFRPQSDEKARAINRQHFWAQSEDVDRAKLLS